MKIAVAVTGASGSIYASRLFYHLERNTAVEEIAAVFSKNAKNIYLSETGTVFAPVGKILLFEDNDFNAPIASGSCSYEALVICPCSAGTMGRIASGVSDSLITRASDVMLKEKRKLVIVLRETPLNLIHIKNMETLTLAGATICPANPSFYSGAKTLEELADTVVLRVLDLLGIDGGGFRWGEKS